MDKTNNTYVFIDSQNLNLGIKGCGWTLDFKRFYIYLKDKYKIKKAFLFIGYMAGNESLYTYLQMAGYIVIFKPTLEIKKDGKIFRKGNVDAELVLHSMIHFDDYNKAMIVSGDGDFYCLIEYLEEKKKLGHVLIPNPRKYSSLLRKYRKYFLYINELERKIGKR
ncbi:MAG: NYN domain-containing protein [Candidatus Zapsychrus exili]|nr:NYN domain-containing protein [Candidatus Zapsychrus exili]